MNKQLKMFLDSNETNSELIERLANDALSRCAKEKINHLTLLIELKLRDVKTFLDRLPVVEKQKFVFEILEHALSEK